MLETLPDTMGEHERLASKLAACHAEIPPAALSIPDLDSAIDRVIRIIGGMSDAECRAVAEWISGNRIRFGQMMAGAMGLM